MKPDIGKTLAGGLVGTLVMTAMMYWVAPLLIGGPMDVAGMLGGMLGVSWATGMILHFVNGVLIFPLVYGLVLYGVLPGGPWMKGATWGFILWLVAEAAVMPMAGAGFFHANVGAMAAAASLMGHLVYGLLLGGIAGAARSGAGYGGAERAAA